MNEDAKILAGVVLLAALVVCAFVWITGNGLGAQVSEVKSLTLANKDALAQLKASGGAGGSGGAQANASPTPNLPKGITMVEGGTSCAAAGGKPKVFFFTDPYCPACKAAEQYVNAFIDEFGSAVEITYRAVITHSGGLVQKYGVDNVTLAHKYFLCVQDEGLDKIQAFKKLFYANLKDDGTDYIPFNATQLAAFAKSAGADAAKIASCLPNAKTRLDQDVQDALKYGSGKYSTPTVVVDCRFTGHSGYAPNAVCYAFPDLAPCKT